ncbi:MAG TPA: LysR family transcriptional regulator [Beijerinckiaceae bacterium]|nr:LysR family transcriptional regulator [Beijerinckiaceae bacterium]
MATPVKLSAIDLNLLVIFDAVMQERNVTRAGERLGLSQPAMSHALTRLRYMLKDDLFVRSPKGMLPTPRAEQLALPVRSALDGLQHSLEPTQFIPAEAVKSFRIAVDNYSAIVLVGPLAGRITKIAPGVTLEFRPSGTLNILDLLDRGELDLAIGSFHEQGERFSRLSLLQDDFVIVLRKGHPAAGVQDLSMELFAGLSHLEISSVPYATDFVDKALARRKLTRRIQLRAPFLSSVRILVASDMVSVLERRVAEELVRYRPLVIRPLPHSSPTLETAMIWPRWLDNQAAHRWLREIIGLVIKGLRSE